MSSAADQNRGDVHYAEACAAAVTQASESLYQAVRLSKELERTLDWTEFLAGWLDRRAPGWHDSSGRELIQNAKHFAGDVAFSLDRTGGRFDELDRHLRWAGQAIRSGQKSLERVGELPLRCVNAANMIDDELRKTWTGLRDVQHELDRTREHVKLAGETVQRVIDLPDSSFDVANVAEAGLQVRGAAVTVYNVLSDGQRMFSRLAGELLDMEGTTEDVDGLATAVARSVRADAEAASRGSRRPWVAVRAEATRRQHGQAPPRSARMRGEDDTAQNRERGGRVR